MDSANIKLCKKLFELSNWSMPIGNHYIDSDNNTICPKYDSGYLLRKLPNTVVHHMSSADRQYEAWYNPTHKIDKVVRYIEDTPEDALCKLAIGMFESGHLQQP